MAKRRRYDIGKVEVWERDQRESIWEWRQEGKRRAVRGIDCIYDVKDQNFTGRNQWSFIVQVPDDRKDSIIVKPEVVPTKKVWSELHRRSVTFVRGTKTLYKGKRYCKVFLSDPSGVKNRIGVYSSDRDDLPKWFKALRGRFRKKDIVTTTRGHDENALVLIVSPDDHEMMIRIFFAMRVWVLEERFQLYET